LTTAQPADTRSQVFGPLVVRYDDRVLTPRPWTLMQSRWAAELAAKVTTGPILELCAGAGQIGLAAAALTGRGLVQVEADPVAAAYARTNAAAADRDTQVEVRNTRIQTALMPGERFSIILADPPYLHTADIARWPGRPGNSDRWRRGRLKPDPGVPAGGIRSPDPRRRAAAASGRRVPGTRGGRDSGNN